MKKTILTAAVSFFAAQSVNANDFFIGADFGRASVKADGDHLHDSSINDLSLGFRAGVNNDEYRIYGLLSNGVSSDEDESYSNGFEEEEENLKYAQLTANIDFFFPINEKLKAFAGPHLGWAFATVEIDSNETNSASETASGLAYGGQFGVIFDVTGNFNIEAGYMHTFTTIDEELKYTVIDSTGRGRIFDTVERDLEIDHVSRFYVAANYTF